THCVASLAATLAATNETATLFFEKVTQELAAPISKQQALKADLCLEERGEQIFGDIIPVPRRQHMQAEAMLIGANLARVAVSNEVPIQSHAASAAFRDATKALRGISESLRQLFSSGGNAPDWLWQPSTVSRTCLRLLCNEPVGDVIEAWRLLSSENRVTDDREYFTELFLSLSCYGEYIAAPEANCIGVEGLFFARNVLVNFNGAQPTLRLWGALPVLAKPGRFAAQIWAMLRLDESLKSFGEAQEALSDGFFQRYCQDAPGGAEKAELRLRLHYVLLLLEAIWMKRRMPRNKALESAGAHCELPAEALLREILRQEVLHIAAMWKRFGLGKGGSCVYVCACGWVCMSA
ncbi:unnamed protein product, partial [Effrenium voratum]